MSHVSIAAAQTKFTDRSRGVATGAYIGMYIPPKSVYLTNFYVVTGWFFSF